MIEIMLEPFDGLSIARQRIVEEAQAQTGFLDLGGLGLTTLPLELFHLRHLCSLNLVGIRKEDGTWHRAYNPQDETICHNEVSTRLGRLGQLSGLRRLSLANLPIADLTPVASLIALQLLDCGGTQVMDSAPLTSLIALQSFECNGTRVVDLTPLSNLTALRSLICSDTPIIVGTQDFERFRLMGDFYRHVPDILATMFDTVQPRKFEDLVQHGFEDLPPT